MIRRLRSDFGLIVMAGMFSFGRRLERPLPGRQQTVRVWPRFLSSLLYKKILFAPPDQCGVASNIRIFIDRSLIYLGLK